MKYRLYHANSLRDLAFSDDLVGDAKTLFAAGEYTFIGYIDADSLDEVYAKTQNLHSPWVQAVPAAQIGAAFFGGCRSTSVGDIIGEDGDRYHVVSPIGFEEIN